MIDVLFIRLFKTLMNYCNCANIFLPPWVMFTQLQLNSVFTAEEEDWKESSSGPTDCQEAGS